jgi:hypothetical protein
MTRAMKTNNLKYVGLVVLGMARVTKNGVLVSIAYVTALLA